VDDGEFNKLGFFASFTVYIKVYIPLQLPSTPAPIIGDEISQLNNALFQQPHA
jgi:hypothetical protein